MVGANAFVCGGIQVGILIAANSIVDFDLTDHSIALGNPGRIIYKENVTQDYR